jgi:hypothetical protein
MAATPSSCRIGMIKTLLSLEYGIQVNFNSFRKTDLGKRV